MGIKFERTHTVSGVSKIYLRDVVLKDGLRANRRQSLAELCNPKRVRLAAGTHRTADRGDPISKLTRRKWQLPDNL